MWLGITPGATQALKRDAQERALERKPGRMKTGKTRKDPREAHTTTAERWLAGEAT